MFSFAKLLPAQLSVLGQNGKQMLEMLVALRRSGIKLRSSNYRPTSDQWRPGKGSCVGLAVTGSTACTDNPIQNTTRMGKSHSQTGTDQEPERILSSVEEFPACSVWVEIWTNEKLSVSESPRGNAFICSTIHVWGRSACELVILTVWPMGFLVRLYRLTQCPSVPEWPRVFDPIKAALVNCWPVKFQWVF